MMIVANPKSPVPLRLNVARGVFLLALGCYVAAHFHPWMRQRSDPLWQVWGRVWEVLIGGLHGRFEVRDLPAAVIIGVTVFVLAMPLLAGFLLQARPLLWVARVLSAGFSVWLTYFNVTRFGSYPGMVTSLGWGCFFVMAAVWLETLGLFVIPKAALDRPGSGPLADAQPANGIPGGGVQEVR